MGSIINIHTNPRSWHIDETQDWKLKATGEPLIKACVGVGDYDYHGADDIVVYIRKQIYDKLLNGEYRVRKRQISLIIEDHDGNQVKPFYKDGQMIY